MNREQAKIVVFNSIKKMLKELEPIDDISSLFDKKTWRKNFIDWLYDNDFVLIAPPGIEFEEDKKDEKSRFMEEFENYDAGGMFAVNLDEEGRKNFYEVADKMTLLAIQEKLNFLAELIDKHKADK